MKGTNSKIGRSYLIESFNSGLKVAVREITAEERKSFLLKRNSKKDLFCRIYKEKKEKEIK